MEADQKSPQDGDQIGDVPMQNGEEVSCAKTYLQKATNGHAANSANDNSNSNHDQRGVNKPHRKRTLDDMQRALY